MEGRLAPLRALIFTNRAMAVLAVGVIIVVGPTELVDRAVRVRGWQGLIMTVSTYVTFLVVLLALTRDFNEASLADSGCILAQQLAVAENIDLVFLCGYVVALEPGFEIGARMFATAAGAECQLPPATVEDRNSAVRHVVAQFQEWAQGAEPSRSR